MTKRLRCTLLADGSSDRALIVVLRWILREHCGNLPVDLNFADLGRLANPPGTLARRIEKSLELYPCDLLFVHRDAENVSIDARIIEIRRAMEEGVGPEAPPVICVVPVRMTEAWLLIDEIAIRLAAGNPGGELPLGMPTTNTLENLTDPKRRLHDLLRDASGLRNRQRRLAHFNRDLGMYVQRVAEQIADFHPLRQLSAFCAPENQLVDRLERSTSD